MQGNVYFKIDIFITKNNIFQTKSSDESKTEFLITTNKPVQLPITDFWPVDYGLANQAFGFKVGPICFVQFRFI